MSEVVLRERADADITTATWYYRSEAGVDVARRFVTDIEKLLRFVSAHPAGGSLRYSFELGIPDLRSMALEHFPYVAFWVPRADNVDVWRVLDTHRDIPRTLRFEN